MEKEKPEAETHTDGNDAAEPAEAGDGCGAVKFAWHLPTPHNEDRGHYSFFHNHPIIIYNHGSVRNMAIIERQLLLEGPIFHFDVYRRKGKCHPF